MAGRRLANVYRSEADADCRAVVAWHDHSKRQRRIHRTGRGHCRIRRAVRADDDQAGAKTRHEEYQFHQCHGPAERATLFDGRRHRHSCQRTHARFPNRCGLLQRTRIHLQQNHPAESQSSAVARPDRRWLENGTHRSGWLLPHGNRQARRRRQGTSVDFGGARHKF